MVLVGSRLVEAILKIERALAIAARARVSPPSPGLEVKRLVFGRKRLKVLEYRRLNGLGRIAFGGGHPEDRASAGNRSPGTGQPTESGSRSEKAGVWSQALESARISPP